ncbi:MAG: hypothetical protein QME05_03915 [Candidatus Margulisbacteria bacterium]|nr:hypothetical protein [Candidatus Margulisiibacteriota bacterium]
MKFNDLYKKLNQHRLYIFNIADAQKLFPREKYASLKVLLCWWKKKKWVKSLKRGLYQLTYPEEKNLPDLYIANRLYEPSYISLETALSMYSLIPEVAFGVTSLTTKPTRRFNSFVYHTIRPVAFTGYRLIKQNGFEVRIAESEKALVDYLYFKRRKKEAVSGRFEKEAVSKLNKKKIAKYAALYSLDIKKAMEGIYAEL